MLAMHLRKKACVISKNSECKVYVYKYDVASDVKPTRERHRYFVEKILKHHLRSDGNICLQFTSLGKPYIDSSYGIDFSYSHSQEGLVVAIVRLPNVVGVDMELLSRENDIRAEAQQAFSTIELVALSEQKNYIKQWCLKEAACKMHGTGFYANPSEITVFKIQNRFKVNDRNGFVLSGYYQYLSCGADVIALCAKHSIETKDIIFINDTDEEYS